MYVLNEQPEEFRLLDIRAKQILTSLRAQIRIKPTKKTIHAQENVFRHTDPAAASLYIIEDGVLPLLREDRVLAHCEAGDLVGFSNFTYANIIRVPTDFAVKVLEYKTYEFLGEVCAQPLLALLWNEYLSIQANLMAIVLGTAIRGETQLEPEIMTVEAGVILIQQGGQPDNVYTLLEGGCDVVVDQVKVGEVGPDQIFGAMAVAVNGVRTATVIARVRSVVMSVPKQKFMDLIETRPGTTLKLIQDLTNTIIDLNTRVVSGSKATVD